jgi:hypothetical protein
MRAAVDKLEQAAPVEVAESGHVVDRSDGVAESLKENLLELNVLCQIAGMSCQPFLP